MARENTEQSHSLTHSMSLFNENQTAAACMTKHIIIIQETPFIYKCKCGPQTHLLYLRSCEKNEKKTNKQTNQTYSNSSPEYTERKKAMDLIPWISFFSIHLFSLSLSVSRCVSMRFDISHIFTYCVSHTVNVYLFAHAIYI